MGGAGVHVPELERMLEETGTDLERTIAECEALNASRPHRDNTRLVAAAYHCAASEFGLVG